MLRAVTIVCIRLGCAGWRSTTAPGLLGALGCAGLHTSAWGWALLEGLHSCGGVHSWEVLVHIRVVHSWGGCASPQGFICVTT